MLHIVLMMVIQQHCSPANKLIQLVVCLDSFGLRHNGPQMVFLSFLNYADRYCSGFVALAGTISHVVTFN